MRRQHKCTPGSHPDIFIPQNHGTPGQCGQFGLSNFQFSSVGAPKCNDRMGWSPLDDIVESIVVDCNDADVAAGIAEGDGHVHPAVGPELAISGTITTGRPTPWMGRNGSPITCSRYAAAYLRSAIDALTGPTLTQDVVFATLCKFDNAVAGNVAFISTASAARYWALLALSNLPSLYVSGDALVTSSSPWHPINAWNLLGATIKVGEKQRLYINGLEIDNDNRPVGAISAAGQRFAIAANGDASLAGWQSHVRDVVAYGDGIADVADATWWSKLAADVFGLLNEQSDHYTYSRDTTRTYYPLGPTGRVHMLGLTVPPTGGQFGRGPDDAISSVTAKNHAWIAADLATHITPLSDVGLTVSLVTDAALADLVELGYYVIRVQNPTGGPLCQRFNNAIGVTSPAWNSIRAHVAAGVVRMGWQTAGGALVETVASVAGATAYDRVAGVASPGAITDRQALELSAGADVTVIIPCAGVGARIPTEVLSLTALGSSASVLQGVVTTTHDPSNEACAIELEIVPDGWNGQTAEAPDAIQAVRVGANNLLTIDAKVDELTLTDGTNSAVAVSDLHDGIESVIRATWAGSSIVVAEQDHAVGIDDYDGAIPAGNLNLPGGPWYEKNFRILRNASIGSIRGPSLPQSTAARLAIPPDIYCIQGSTFDLVKTSLIVGVPSDYTWNITTTLASSQTATRITIGDGTEVEGDYDLTISLSIDGVVIDSITTTVHLRDDMVPADPTWDLVLCGDSIMLQGAPGEIITAGGGHLVARGTQAAAGGTLCEAYGGQTSKWFSTNAASPWTAADRVIDIAAYITAIGATPEAIVIMLGTNDLSWLTWDLEYIESAIQSIVSYYDRLIAAWETAVPGIKIGIATTPPGATEQSVWDLAYPPAGTITVIEWRTRHHRLIETLIARYSDILVPVHCHIDGATDYPANNAVHPDASGDTAIANAIYAWLVAAMT